MNSEILYTKSQKKFIRNMIISIPEIQKYLDNSSNIFEEDRTFFSALYPFIDLVYDAILQSEYSLAEKTLNLIEEYLRGANEESKNHLSYLFFETLTNRLGWQDPKYMKKFVEMLGSNCKECCRIVDKFWGTKTPGL